MIKKLTTTATFLMLFTLEAGLYAQLDLTSGATTVKNIMATVASVVLALVGLMGIGRAAYKFSTGDQDATTSLLTGIVATVLAVVAQGLAGK